MVEMELKTLFLSFLDLLKAGLNKMLQQLIKDLGLLHLVWMETRDLLGVKWILEILDLLPQKHRVLPVGL